MKYPAFVLTSLVLTAAMSQASVDPSLLGLVMPDAAVIAGVQVEQSQASPFGRYLVGQVQPMLTAQRDRLALLTGFDPQRDLREVIVAATAGKKGVVIGRGVFQPGKITSAALLGGAKVSNYRGTDLITDAGLAASVAFLDASTVALGDVDNIKAVIDRRVTSSLFRGALADRARDISGLNDAWVVTNVPVSSLAAGQLPAGNPQAQFLQSIQEFSGGVRFGSSTVTVNGQAKMQSDRDAQALADVLKLLAGMAQNGKDPKVTTIVSAAKFSAQGSTTSVTVELAEADAEQLIAPDKPRPSARPRPRAR